MFANLMKLLKNATKTAKKVKAAVTLNEYTSKDGVEYILMPNGERRRKFPKTRGKSERRQLIAKRHAALTYIHNADI